jgi:hypothetical protein
MTIAGRVGAWWVLWAVAGFAWAEPRTITVDPGEASGAAIQRAIDGLRQSGGRIELTHGRYDIDRGLRLDRVKNIEIIGGTDTTLVFRPAPLTRMTRPVGKGAVVLEVEATDRFYRGAICEIYDGQRVYLADARVAAVAAGRLELASPLTADIPAGASIMLLENVIQGYLIEDIRIANLRIDVQGRAQPAYPRNHSRHCGIFISGRYSYAGGAQAYSRNITIENVTVLDAPHRGVAFYATLDSRVLQCTVEDAGAEAINIDHFCRRFQVKRNTVRRSKVGVEINDGSDVLVEGNQIIECDTGIKIWRYEPCVMQDANTRNKLTGNVVGRPGRYGIWLGRSVAGNTIMHNTIEIESGARPIHVVESDNEVAENQVLTARSR